MARSSMVSQDSLVAACSREMSSATLMTSLLPRLPDVAAVAGAISAPND